MMTYITGSKPEYPWDKGCQEIEKYRMAILDDDMFFHIALMLSIITDYVNNKMWMNSNNQCITNSSQIYFLHRKEPK